MLLHNITLHHITSYHIHFTIGMAAAVTLSSVLGMIFYSIAFLVNDAKRLEAKVDRKALVRTQYLKYRENHVHSLASASEDTPGQDYGGHF